MSTTEHINELDGEVENIAAPDRAVLGRTFGEVQIQADGRNVEMFCCPFDTPSVVVDPVDKGGDGIPYEEEFARGAFAAATKAPNRVYLEFEHWAPGLSGVIGRGASLVEHEDGLYGNFRMLNTQDGDKALELIHDEVLTDASVFFAEMRNRRMPNGRVRREKVHLMRVSLCQEGAYPQAKVLAVRSKPVIAQPALPALPFDPDLAAAFGAAGFTVPDGLRTAEDK